MSLSVTFLGPGDHFQQSYDEKFSKNDTTADQLGNPRFMTPDGVVMVQRLIRLIQEATHVSLGNQFMFMQLTSRVSGDFCVQQVFPRAGHIRIAQHQYCVFVIV